MNHQALSSFIWSVADLLRGITGPEPVTDDERVIAAFARGDEVEAARIRA